MKIKINENEKLASYKHACRFSDAEKLVAYISGMSKRKFRVEDAWVIGDYVPNTYKYTKGMLAPGFKFYRNAHTGNSPEIDRTPFSLESRSFGRGKRFKMVISSKNPNAKTPDGWKCLKRTPTDTGVELYLCG